MRGAAMKLGQVLSTIDFAGLPEDQREEFKATLAALRDDVPPLPFDEVCALIEEELERPVEDAFESFEESAFAAASIGQVHRAVTKDGRHVAVKVQYPGIAEAVDTDLRNLNLLLPVIKRLAPGMDVRALAAELRERVGEELDYEIEAQNHRAIARAWRGHPFVHVPAVDTRLSSRRLLVTELLDGRRFEEVKTLDQATRDRFGEIVFRFFFGTLLRLHRCSGDPHPGNYLLLDERSGDEREARGRRRVGFLDFGLMRDVNADYLDLERGVATAAAQGDADAVFAGMRDAGYLPDPDSFEPERVLGSLRVAGEWYYERGFRRFSPAYVADLIERSSSPRSEYFEDMRRMSLPPQALLIRRMEGLVLSTLGELRAGADWQAIAAEYYADAPPSTPLGEQDAEFWAARR
jgi:predicted unusual protein kinase regulating ubiquinone biosynthesis (AarF/ABC1/UbiB family)